RFPCPRALFACQRDRAAHCAPAAGVRGGFAAPRPPRRTAGSSRPPNGRRDHPALVTVIICDEYVEFGAMSVASCLENGYRQGKIHYRQVPFGDDGFDLAYEFDVNRTAWFLTRYGPPWQATPPRGVVNMLAIKSLIAGPQSPICPLFRKHFC